MAANLALAASVPIAPEEWNDAPGRTREQVLQALNRATTMIEWPSAGGTGGRVTLARVRRRLVTHGRFDHSEEYDYSEAYELLNVSDRGQFVLRAASGEVVFFQAGGLYADIEIRCEACERWADHVALTDEAEPRWVCHGGASPCEV